MSPTVKHPNASMGEASPARAMFVKSTARSAPTNAGRGSVPSMPRFASITRKNGAPGAPANTLSGASTPSTMPTSSVSEWGSLAESGTLGPGANAIGLGQLQQGVDRARPDGGKV